MRKLECIIRAREVENFKIMLITPLVCSILRTVCSVFLYQVPDPIITCCCLLRLAALLFVAYYGYFPSVFSLPIFSRRFSPCVSLRPREDHDQRLFSRAWYHCCVTPSRRYRLASILCSSWRFPHVLEY